MLELSVSNKIVDFSSISYLHGKRLGFVSNQLKANPSEERGRSGIRYHTGISRLFHKTVHIKRENKDFYLNRKSLIKWYNAHVIDNEALKGSEKNSELVAKINNLETVLSHSNKVRKQSPVQVNKRSVYSLVNRVRAGFWSLLCKFSESSWINFQLTYGLFRSETLRAKGSELLATRAFRMVGNVPAYTNFLNSAKVKKFNDVPVATKDNFIKPALENPLTLYRDAKIPVGSRNDTSTGTSGEPTQWYHGPEEVKRVEVLSSYIAKAQFGNKPYYLIDGFALGQWATGITVAVTAANDPNATTSTPGNDPKTIFTSIKQATKVFKGPIVVCGYPPHMREVVRLANEEGFPLHNYDITVGVGGEAMTEGQRMQIIPSYNEEGAVIRTGFKRCYSSYGASDLNINIGYENDYVIELRRACLRDPELAKELFGENELVPMVFSYNDLYYHVETNEEQNLIYTCLRDKISPRIRYDLGDRGKTMPFSDVEAILKKHGVTIKDKPPVNLPLLFIWGRQGTHVNYGIAGIAPGTIDEAIRRSGHNDEIAHYGLLEYVDESTQEKVIEILIEFDDDDNSYNGNLLKKEFIEKMCEMNQDFKSEIEKHSEEKGYPKLRIFKKGQSPMAQQREKYAHAKKMYIFKGGTEFAKDVKTLPGAVY